MNHASLTARYRPQTFAEVAGQDTVKAILSRAAAEDRVAPAYLFSGTRGVGKTTIARIFAKALNCERAPTGEPCNACEACRKITQGMAVDVVEIDGASNRGIEDAKRLKENIGYAPLEGRYKVFIIDEAHMLTRDAFNALLKTLEEPPARVTFFLATTEPHKFPVTIISRCQHFVFKRLSQAELERHLGNVLNRERIDFEPEAVTLIARRASGSVRDSMSLLGQVLALGENGLTAHDAREVLGLAGQDVFFTLLDAILARDCLAVVELVRALLDRGADIGFFLRELTSLWRNLFILAQSGEGGLPVVDLPEAEAARFLRYAEALPLAHIHACWQMTLEGQRRVLTSIEPAQALELLLLNLAALPRLLPVWNFDPAQGAPVVSAAQASSSKTAPAVSAAPAGRVRPVASVAARAGRTETGDPASRSECARQPVCARTENGERPTVAPEPAEPDPAASGPVPTKPARDAAVSERTPETPRPEGTCSGKSSATVTPADSSVTEASSLAETPIDSPISESSEVQPPAPNAAVSDGVASPVEDACPRPVIPDAAWEEFTAFCKKRGPQERAHVLSIAKGVWPSENRLFIEAASALHLERMREEGFAEWVRGAARDFRATDVFVRIAPPPARKSRSEQREELLASPTVKLVSAQLSATLLDFWDKEPKGE